MEFPDAESSPRVWSCVLRVAAQSACPGGSQGSPSQNPVGQLRVLTAGTWGGRELQ